MRKLVKKLDLRHKPTVATKTITFYNVLTFTVYFFK